MKHIAVLSNGFYPEMVAPSVVFYNYMKPLENEYNFHIITKTNKLYFALSTEYDLYYISSFRHRLYQRCLKNIREQRYVLVSKILLLIIRICLVIQTQYAFPNTKKWEINAYYKKLRKLYDIYHFDVIVAVSDYFVTQLAALKFKKEHPSVKWIVFATDPYSNNYVYYNRKLFKSFWKRLNIRAEQKIYDEANYCLFTPELYSYVINNFKIDITKVATIHYLLSQRIADCVKQNINHEDCKLLFAGNVYRKIRNPEYMLSVLSKVEGIHVNLFVGVGDCDDIINQYVSEKIRRELFVPREKYEKMICEEYDILLNMGNVSTLQFPSKTLELLSTGKPILNFCFVKDRQYEMIEKYPLGLNILNGEENAVEKIEKFCQEMKGKTMLFSDVEKLFPENNLHSQIELLRRLIES